MEPTVTITNRRTGEVKQVPQSQLGNYNVASSQTQQPQPQPQQNNSLLKTLLPLIGSIGGGLLGVPLGPAGVIGGGALGGAGGAALAGGGGGDILKEGAMGAFGGLFPAFKAGKLLGAGAKVAEKAGVQTAERAGSSLATKIGGKISGAGENLATRSIRPSPSQYTGFLEKSGQTLGKFASKKGLVGKPAEQVRDSVIKPLQQSFDDIATNSNLNVSSEALFSKFNQRIQTLRGSLAEGDLKKADKLEKTMMDIINKYKGKPIPAKEITLQRRNFDDYVKNFNDPIEADTNDEIRRLLQGTLQESADKAGLAGSAGQTLKQMGAELQDLYEFGKISAKQEGLGKGTMPFGITRLGGVVAGGAAGGSYGPEAGPGDNIRNALLGMGLVSAANNPKILSLLSKALIGIGEKVSKIPIPAGLGSNIVGQVGSRVLSGGGIQEAQAAELPAPGVSTTPTQSKPDITEFLKMAALADLGSGGKNISEIIALSNFLNPAQSASTKTQMQQIEGAQGLVNQLEGVYTQASQAGELGPYGRGSLSTLTGKITGGGMAGNAALYDNLRQGFTALIARSTGERGVLTDADAARAMKLIPDANTTPAFADRQFEEIRKIFRDSAARISGQGQWNPTIPQPTSLGA